MKAAASAVRTKRIALTFIATLLVALIAPAALLSPEAEAAESDKAANTSRYAQISQNINTLVSNLPILPPDKASRPFDSTLKVSGLPVGKFFRLLARPPFLDMNMVIATNSENLDRPFDVNLTDITVGELFNLILQLNGLKAIRFNEKTLIIVAATDKNSYGVKQRKTYKLTYFMPEKMVEFIGKDNFLKVFFEKTTFIPNDVQRNMLVIGSPDEMILVDYIVDLLDRKPDKIHARIPLNNMEFSDLKTALTEMLPEDIASAIDTERWVYSKAGRAILVYDDPTTVELLRKLVTIIDIPPKQVLIDIALMEVSSNFSREIGMKLGSSSFTVDSLDKLFSLSRLSRFMNENSLNPAQTAVSYLLQQSGGRALASPKVRCLDGETADINIGEIRNIRVQSTEFNSNTGGATQQTTFNTQEVPIGVQLNVKPEVHNDGTVTLDLSISDEAVLAIQDFGVDRTTRNSTTKLRIKDGETVIMGGFISQNRDWDKTPIPILGQLPLIGRLFRAGKRTKIDSELVFLITPYILDFEKDANSIKPKTIADMRKDFTNDLEGSSVASSTTRWLEDDNTKTKLILDASGNVLYRQTWSKATGKPVGHAVDLRSEAERAADPLTNIPIEVAQPVVNNQVPAPTVSVTANPRRRMTPEEFRSLMQQPLKAPVPVAPTPTTVPTMPPSRVIAPQPTTSVTPVTPQQPATGQVKAQDKNWDQLLNSLDNILGTKNGA